MGFLKEVRGVAFKCLHYRRFGKGRSDLKKGYPAMASGKIVYFANECRGLWSVEAQKSRGENGGHGKERDCAFKRNKVLVLAGEPRTVVSDVRKGTAWGERGGGPKKLKGRN